MNPLNLFCTGSFMKLLIYSFLFVLLLQGNQRVIAQPNATKAPGDTVRETVVYEYDTVYVAPDTLRLVDTLVHFLPEEKKVTPEIKPIPAPVKTYHWALGFFFSPSLSGMLDRGPVMDSSSTERVVNMGYHVQVQVGIGKWIYHLAAGWSPIHERIHFNEQYFTTGNYVSGVYDSLYVKSEAVIDNYYDYLTASLGLGRKWETRKFSYFCQASFGVAFLTGHRASFLVNHQLNTALPASSIRTTDYSVAIDAGIAYKFSKRISWQVAPYYQHTIASVGKHPFGNLQILGIRTGFLLFL
jgi:hypothetical protein